MEKKTVFKLFHELVEGLNQAEGAASQLIHASGNPKTFIGIREALAVTKSAVLTIAPQNQLIKPKTVYTNGR